MWKFDGLEKHIKLTKCAYEWVFYFDYFEVGTEVETDENINRYPNNVNLCIHYILSYIY